MEILYFLNFLKNKMYNFKVKTYKGGRKMEKKVVLLPEIIDKVANNEEIDVPKYKVEQIIKEFLETVKDETKKGNVVKIHKFAKFYVVERDEREGVNPRTGEKIVIPKKKVVRVSLSKSFKEI